MERKIVFRGKNRYRNEWLYGNLAQYKDGSLSIDGVPVESDSVGQFVGVAHDERHYKLNKKAKVGTQIVCAGPKCNNRFIKKSYQQCFCCTRHKDQFWNRREAHFGYRKPI